jgi:hypothetical protein
MKTAQPSKLLLLITFLFSISAGTFVLQLSPVIAQTPTDVGALVCPDCPSCLQTQVIVKNQCEILEQMPETGEVFRVIEKQVSFITTDEELRTIVPTKINETPIVGVSFDVNGTSIKVTGDRLILEGTAAPNAFVSLLIDSDPLVLTTIADKDGNWRISVRNFLEDGTHHLYAVSRSSQTGEIKTQKLVGVLDVPQPEGSLFEVADPILVIIGAGCLLSGVLVGWLITRPREGILVKHTK